MWNHLIFYLKIRKSKLSQDTEKYIQYIYIRYIKTIINDTNKTFKKFIENLLNDFMNKIKWT